MPPIPEPRAPNNAECLQYVPHNAISHNTHLYVKLMKNNKITVTVLCSFQNCAHSLSGKVMQITLQNNCPSGSSRGN